MSTIIIATDFSPASLNAAHYAAAMAQAVGKNLLLLHIYTPPVAYSDIPLTINLADMTEGVEKELQDCKALLEQSTNRQLKIDTQVRMGAFFQELKAACEEVQPYVVIMGSQGTTAAERFFFGGHTVYAMQHLKWPLITVPPQARFLYIKRMGFACDFEKVEENTPVTQLHAFQQDFGAALHVLNVGSEHEFAPEMVYETGVMNELLSTLNPQYHFIAHNDTDQALMDFVANYHIHLLVVLPRQHDLADRLLHKSHTKQLVLHSQVPVMALHV